MDHHLKLRVSKIEKRFPGVKALDQIDFTIRAGSVHVLCGENGAGKSTLMKIINGLYQPDAGQIYIDEKPVRIHNPMEARSLGISMIFQEMNYVPELTVAENLFLGNLPIGRSGKVNWRLLKQRTAEILAQNELTYSPDTKMKDLKVSDIQMLEIARAVSGKCSVIIMDEPTSAITARETDALFTKIRSLKEQGIAIVYISHKLDEVFQIADEITILRDGSVVGSKPASELDKDTVIAMMVGRKLDGNYPKDDIVIGEELLSTKHLNGKGFSNISFHVNQGEIIGFSGLMGAGRTEVMRALFGLDPILSGEVKVRGKAVRFRCPRDSIRHKIAMLTEDRRRFGIIPVRSVMENGTLASLEQIFYRGRLHVAEEKSLVRKYFERMNVKTPTLETPIQALSGGNQQKVLFARWMMRDPDILILDEPTRGIDVGAKYEIYRLISELAREKKAVIMVSSELPELIGMCDRIYVMNQGEITGEIVREEFDQERIMQYAIGHR